MSSLVPSHYNQRMQSSDRLALGPTPTPGAGRGVAFLLTQCVCGGVGGGFGAEREILPEMADT